MLAGGSVQTVAPGPLRISPVGFCGGLLDVPALSGWPTASQKERELRLAVPS